MSFLSIPIRQWYKNRKTSLAHGCSCNYDVNIFENDILEWNFRFPLHIFLQHGFIGNYLQHVGTNDENPILLRSYGRLKVINFTY